MLDTAEVLHAAVPLLMRPPRDVPNPILVLQDSKATDDRVALFALFGVRVPAPVAGSEKLGRGKGGLLHVTAYTPWLMPRQEIRNGYSPWSSSSRRWYGIENPIGRLLGRRVESSSGCPHLATNPAGWRVGIGAPENCPLVVVARSRAVLLDHRRLPSQPRCFALMPAS